MRTFRVALDDELCAHRDVPTGEHALTAQDQDRLYDARPARAPYFCVPGIEIRIRIAPVRVGLELRNFSDSHKRYACWSAVRWGA